MIIASLELSKTLFELSGWQADNIIYGDLLPNEKGFKRPVIAYEYDLGYLLRKLPTEYEVDLVAYPLGGWQAGYEFDKSAGIEAAYKYEFHADTPEDAACKLAIELFKQGILKS